MALFQKGQSGNPGGRPQRAIADLTALARTHTPEAIKALVDVCKKGTPAARVSAAIAILDRGYGRPVQTIDQTGNKPVERMTDEELEAAIRDAEAREKEMLELERLRTGKLN